MNEAQNKRVLDALRKIEIALEEIKDLFPLIPAGQIKIKVANPKYTEPLKILKRVNGIIKNLDESNAERKLKSLLEFLGVTLTKRRN